MKKGLLLIIALSGLWLNAFSQPNGSFEEYYYMGSNRPFYMSTVATNHAANNWYIEGRYNYDAINAVSAYLGKSFEKTGLFSYSITPVAGLVGGRFNGGSVGANIALNCIGLSLSSQSQYTFSIQNKATNFIYSLSDLTYHFKIISAGVSLQQTAIYQAGATFEKGILIRAEFEKFSFPLYIFNPSTSERYIMLGLVIQWGEEKKTEKSSLSIC
ncbi:MAG TPA: hypothetical protein VGN20_09630 [Mucilaginibacter sp.]|jgi:hypothetical protein